MTTLEPSFVGIEIRSYDKRLPPDRHPYAQLVLPVTGEVELEIEGRHGRLDPLHGAVVAPGVWHAQRSIVDNRSLILDIEEHVLVHEGWAGVLDKPYKAISPAARKLIEFMHICMSSGSVKPAIIQGWMPLLFDILALGSPQVHSRLSALLTQVEAQPGLPWSTESMASFARISVSHLHTLFRNELNCSPRAWLLRKRIDFACELLTHTKRTIADIALSSGFADQSVLTRAMRQSIDTTPAAYRAGRQETRQKS